MDAAEKKGDEEHLSNLSDALVEIDSALERLYTVGSLDEPQAPQAPMEAEPAAPEPLPEPTVQAAISADLYGDDEEEEEETESESDEPEMGEGMSIGQDDEEKPARQPGPGIGLGFKRREPEPVDDLDDEEDDNPVKMTNKLRKEMGDSSADFLDDYALAIYEKVDEFFDNLVEKALDLGEEDDADGENDLIEMLRDEVGKRGVARILPVFEEWRAGLIKQVMKDVNERFAPPEPTPEPMAEEDMGGMLGLDDMGDDNAEAMEEALDEDAASEPGAEDEGAEEGAEEPVEASAPRRLSDVVKGPVSFKMPARKPVSASVASPSTARATDFKPSGHSTPRLE
jgi:hypothetical protein